MTKLAIVFLAAAAFAASLAQASTGSVRANGVLTGRTLLYVGCPAERPGGTCVPSHPFPDARFTAVRLSSTGIPIPSTTRTVTSNAAATFAVSLRAGSYRLTPQAQQGTRGGVVQVVRILAGKTTTVTIRFDASHLRV